MNLPELRTGSHGSSILGSILLLAFAGGAAFAIEPLLPFDNLNQLAVSVLTTVEPSTAPLSRAEKDDLIVKDDIPSQTVTAAVPPYTVFYSCTQRGEVSEVKQLTQNCKPGFNYTVRVSDGKVTVIPTASGVGSTCPANAPEATKKCNDSISPTPVKSCASYAQQQPCKIFYCVGGKCQLGGEAPSGGELGVEENLLAGIGNVIKKEDTVAGRGDLLEKAGLGAPTNNALLGVFSTEKKIEEIQSERMGIPEKIATYDGCTTHACAEQVSMLRLEDSKLEGQQQALRTQLDGLKNNAQRI